MWPREMLEKQAWEIGFSQLGPTSETKMKVTYNIWSTEKPTHLAYASDPMANTSG